jgi:hypothetical protein
MKASNASHVVGHLCLQKSVANVQKYYTRNEQKKLITQELWGKEFIDIYEMEYNPLYKTKKKRGGDSIITAQYKFIP